MKTVEVTIHADGEVNIEALNFKGVGCKDATKDLELVLAGGGTDNKDTRPKPDFYNTVAGKGTLTR